MIYSPVSSLSSARSRPASRPAFHLFLAALAACILCCGGCAVGPDYMRPDAPTPDAYKENAIAVAESDWRPANPGELDPGPWWETFQDPALNGLMEKVEEANQSVAAALASLRLARAQAREARAAFFPTLGGSASDLRGRNSPGAATATSYRAQLQSAWELDIWGGTRRGVESGDAAAEAAVANLGDVILSLRGDLAQNYFQLRTLDELLALYRESVTAYERSLAITRNQFEAGTVTKVDVAQAMAQLKATQAQVVDLDLQRRQLEHAIATQMGTTPSHFSIAPAPLTAYLPAIAPELPASLLERRPDIAAAERMVAAANARIGVAKSAYYPAFSFAVSGGYGSSLWDRWLMAPARIWSVGPSMAWNLFQGGALFALTDQAVAVWERSVAQYRQTVLDAFREVEDQLAAANLLEREGAVQAEAALASREAERLFMNQYRAGIVTYLSVVSAQTTALANARNLVSILGRRFVAAVSLIRALGGGWDNSAMRTDDGVRPPVEESPPAER